VRQTLLAVVPREVRQHTAGVINFHWNFHSINILRNSI
jgi:hypothetical protein